MPEAAPALPALVDPADPPSVPGEGLGAVVVSGVDPGELGAGVADGAPVDDGLPPVDPPPEEEPDWANAPPAARPPARITTESVR
ncbi:hypothetical protein [Microvirga aerophila]|uniref:Uncharacterized protein n=1 Tax=Microvirga aerophila TaxID=670291 RepID=A0A512BQY3_9HYPH|nr:hypothetical protein [Microvirga aerophila]GEO14227.1 hypothetical protein MAE02_19230 [Microvirga aerophila]